MPISLIYTHGGLVRRVECTVKYRLEPVVELLNGKVIGHELLAGEKSCPSWDKEQWDAWYSFLAGEVPLLFSSLPGALFVNFSGEQILDKGISRIVRGWKDHSERMVLEWTEHHFRDDQLVDIMTKLNFLKGLGFRVAIDDIGAGVDGLGRAASVKSSFCKIDGHYFHVIRDNEADLRGLCQHLALDGTRVVVEWVETDADYQMALASGAELGQGRYFSGK